MPNQMAVIIHPTSGDMHMSMTASQFTDEDAKRWRAKGFIVEVIPYEEYERRCEAASAFEKAERHARHVAMGWTNLQGIEIPLDSIPKEGLQVRFRFGECFGEEIEWFDVDEGILMRTSCCNINDEPGIEFRGSNGVPQGWGFAGWEPQQKIWWRYKAEAKPGAYREHCAQIISLLSQDPIF
jgi:hypothetical protein